MVVDSRRDEVGTWAWSLFWDLPSPSLDFLIWRMAVILVFTSRDGMRINATLKMTGSGQILTQGRLGRGGWSQPEEGLTPGPGSHQSLLPLGSYTPHTGYLIPQDWYPL